MVRDLMDWTSIDVEHAPRRGPVAAGGNLEPAFVYSAYRHGMYPAVAWDDEKLAHLQQRFGEALDRGEIPLLPTERKHPLQLTWLSPDPRAIVRAADLHEVREVRRAMRQSGWSSSVDRAFGKVIRACRAHHPKTWITPDMIDLYEALHQLDLAHSVEVWDGDELVGGTFGLLTGGVFSIESNVSPCHRRLEGGRR